MIETPSGIIVPFHEVTKDGFTKEGFGWTAWHGEKMWVSFQDCASRWLKQHFDRQNKPVPPSIENTCVAWRDICAAPKYFEFPGERPTFLIFTRPERDLDGWPLEGLKGIIRRSFRTERNVDDFHWVQWFINKSTWSSYDLS